MSFANKSGRPMVGCVRGGVLVSSFDHTMRLKG